MSKFKDLPEELKVTVLEHLFNDDAYIEMSSYDQQQAQPSQRKYDLSFSLSSIDKAATLPYISGPGRSIVHVQLHLPSTYQTLFTSNSFLTTALPVFIKVTIPKLLAVDFHSCATSSPKVQSQFRSLPARTLHTILNRTTHIKISTDRLLSMTFLIPTLRDLLPSLLIVTAHDLTTLCWSRFNLSGPRTWTATRRVPQDVFQTSRDR